MNIGISKNIIDWDILQSATINGAIALKIDSLTGSLDVGKEADISLISTDGLGMSPIRPDKLISLLIYSASPRNVKYVISDGKILVENGHLVKVNEAKLAINLTRIATDVDSKIKSGKIWSASFKLNPQLLKDYWYKYRSIRLADSVNLMVINNFMQPVKVTIISSGAVFGGGAPTVVDQVVSARFPEEKYSKSFKEQFMLKAHDSIHIVKNHKTYNYQITTSLEKLERSTGSGQFLLLVEK